MFEIPCLMKTCSPLTKCLFNRVFSWLFFCALVFSMARRACADQVSSLSGGLIGVHFDQTVTNTGFSALDTANYTILGKGAAGAGIFVTNAVLQSDSQTVGLYLNTDPGEFFAVGISNILDDVGTMHNGAVTGYTSDFTNVNIGTADDPIEPGQAVSGAPDTFYLTASGSGIGGDTNDHCQFVSQQVSNNFDMSVLVTQLDQSNVSAQACLMAREDLSAGSASIEICLEPGSSNIVMLVRSNSSDIPVSFAAPVFIDSLCWLRMTCISNFYTVYYGTNGVDWTVSGSLSLPLDSPYVGMAVSSGTNGLTSTGGFTEFSLSGARPGDGVVPTLGASIYQGTNLVVQWQRTPRDFAVQVITNLNRISPSNTWGFLMLPIFDTSLTGTNAEVPNPATRYMTIPMNLFSNKQMFVRLAEVERVIPDPPLTVTAGLILSLGAGNLVTGNSGSGLCGKGVAASSVVTQPANTVLVCPAGHTYQFTTAPSGSLLHTYLQTRNYFTGGTTCDTAFTAGNYKAQITFSIPSNSFYTNYTFIAAATTDTDVTNGIQVQVNILK